MPTPDYSGKGRPAVHGQTMPDLDTLWQLYLRRFCIEHLYRFIKQRLHGCLPHLGTAAQTHAWSTLMPLMSWQLWLARTDCPDCPLSWQKPMTDKTPGRVANAFSAILVSIGTPAETPQTPRKVFWLARGQKTNPAATLSNRKKDLFQA